MSRTTPRDADELPPWHGSRVDVARNELAELVCAKIRESGLSQAEVTRAAGLGSGTISSMVWGRRTVGIEAAVRILAALGYRLVFAAEPVGEQPGGGGG